MGRGRGGAHAHRPPLHKAGWLGGWLGTGEADGLYQHGFEPRGSCEVSEVESTVMSRALLLIYCLSCCGNYLGERKGGAGTIDGRKMG